MTWLNWKPVVVFLGLGSIAGTILSFDALYLRVSELMSGGGGTFAAQVCNTASDGCDNEALDDLLRDRVGESVELDLTYVFSGAGEAYVSCADEGVFLDPEENGSDLIVPIQIEDGSCSALSYLRVDAGRAVNVASAMAYLEYRIKGPFTVGIGSYGGPALFTLYPE